MLKFSFFTFCSLIFLFSCKKNFNPSPGSTGIDTSRLLKEYRIYFQPGVQPDSVIGEVSYDTINRAIILKQYFNGFNGGSYSWKYTYDPSGYLTGVYDITGGSPGTNIITVSYDQNMEVNLITAYDGPIDHIAYATNFTSAGKEVIFYDTAESGYLGGARFGIGKIIYNDLGQITFRGLTGGRPSSPFFDTTQQKSVKHEFFSYDLSGNLAVYQNGGQFLYNANGSGNNLPSSVRQEIYSQHDTRGNELYEFEQILLKGVINKLSGNALIDPFGDVVGGSSTYFFQNTKFPPLQANIRVQFNGTNDTWDYQDFSNQPVYDSIGRLRKTTLFNSDAGIGSADIYLEYQ